MTQFFDDFMEQRKDWGLVVSPQMQAIINKTDAIDKAFQKILLLFSPYYPDNKANDRNLDEMCTPYNAMMDEIEKRIIRFILTESDSDSNMKQD